MSTESGDGALGVTIAKYETINREQNLDDPGLRQANESYKPIGFVRKHRAFHITNSPAA